ncbi:MCP four helix bundle domain-containing protein [Flavobacterium sp.]|uniref:MCP four helix bundle domain-containing protein n=1 Tax=Flavobacterium sp. TaxID=239 RepID=UPI003F69A090
MAFYNKVKWILGILIVFVLIMATNLIDRNNFLQIKQSVETLYEDRLVAYDILFEMTNIIHEKEVALGDTKTNNFIRDNKKRNEQIKNLVARFEQTKLITEENNLFNNLKNNLDLLVKNESNMIQSNFVDISSVQDQILIVKEDLYSLSKIQLEEGKNQLSISKKAIDVVELFTQIEIYILIFLAVIIQIIILYNPKKQ